MQPTPEQEAIIEAAVNTQENLLINALAGAAKTTTLRLICEALPTDSPIQSLAFNKRIADEMAKVLPGNVRAQTMNSVGHRVWGAAVGPRLQIDKDKTYNLLKPKGDKLKGKQRDDFYDLFSETRRAISRAKMLGYIPEGAPAHGRSLITQEDFLDSDFFEDELTDFQIQCVDEVLRESIKLAYDGKIDFDDQIYMPTLFGGTFPKFPLVMVDEAQDLSSLNHAMLAKLVTKRLIAVGDPWQSIYAFRGANTSSMALLKKNFQMREMNLSISFRCPQAVVRKAQSRVPHMRFPDWAIEGLVETKELWKPEEIPDGAAIICRNNAPLLKCALDLLKAGRGVKLVGTDLGPQLIKALKKLGDETMSKEETLHAISEWEEAKKKKNRGKAAVADKADCLRVFASFGETLGAAISYAEHIFAASGPIQLLSGHKAKGLEWDTVFHLDPWRVPSRFAEAPEDVDQELNIRYVIETRAKKELFLVDLDKLVA